MKALFLASGIEIGLQTITGLFPRSMIPIMNKPLLERTFLNLKKCGITEIVLNSSNQTDYMKNYFGNGSNLGLQISYIEKDHELGTGGIIKKAERIFKKTFMVFTSDILSDIDLSKMIDFHKEEQAIATIAVTETEEPAGIYIFEPKIFKEIAVKKYVSLENEFFPRLLEKSLKIATYQSCSYWMDITTIEKYTQAHMDIMSGKCNLVDCDLNMVNISYGENVKVHPNAKITGPAYIGNNVIIGDGVIINNSVIGDDVYIASSSRITGCIIWNDVTISKDVKMTNTIVLSECCVNDNANLFQTVYNEEIIPLVG